MVQFPDGVVWGIFFIIVIILTIGLGIFFIKKGVQENKKKFIALGIASILALFVALFLFSILVRPIQY